MHTNWEGTSRQSKGKTCSPERRRIRTAFLLLYHRKASQPASQPESSKKMKIGKGNVYDLNLVSPCLFSYYAYWGHTLSCSSSSFLSNIPDLPLGTGNQPTEGSELRRVHNNKLLLKMNFNFEDWTMFFTVWLVLFNAWLEDKPAIDEQSIRGGKPTKMPFVRFIAPIFPVLCGEVTVEVTCSWYA